MSYISLEMMKWEYSTSKILFVWRTMKKTTEPRIRLFWYVLFEMQIIWLKKNVYKILTKNRIHFMLWENYGIGPLKTSFTQTHTECKHKTVHSMASTNIINHFNEIILPFLLMKNHFRRISVKIFDFKHFEFWNFHLFYMHSSEWTKRCDPIRMIVIIFNAKCL